MIYQALQPQTKAAPEARAGRASDGLIDKHHDFEHQTQEGVNFIMFCDSAWFKVRGGWARSRERIEFMLLKYGLGQLIIFLFQAFVAV